EKKLAAYRQLKEGLEKGILAKDIFVEEEFATGLPLITIKPTIYVINVAEADLKKEINFELQPSVVICAKVEAELVELNPEEQKDYLKELGLEQSGLERLIQESYELLGLITYFTAGEKEVRAWTIHIDTKAPQAAGVIHTDFEKGFIKAEVINWEKLVSAGGWNQAREKGLVRLEGRDYLFQDGDTTIFKFNN
ncbi:MAG TPA: DUF933 domain-containing protein, partial [Candidatus Saccharimonadales bacterium]|nr:DUF933 domain-containing protein [Candidatus Saccharimonadales bacterium]